MSQVQDKINAIRVSIGKRVVRPTLDLMESQRGLRELVQGSRAVNRVAGSGWNQVVEFFLRLKIRLKLSAIVATAIIATTFILSTIVTRIQERELRLQTEALGKSIVLGLSSSARDNLLLNSASIIQDYVKNFNALNIPGLEHLYVVNREGTIVAHLNAENVNKQIAPEEWDAIVKADSATQVETAGSLQFVQAITVSKREGHGTRKILLGGSTVSFSKTSLLAHIEEMKSRILLYSFGISFVTIGFVYGFSKRLVNIIVVLSDAARKVGAGDLKVTVVTRIKDELGMLARDFNFMVVQIREKVEMQKFVSKSTVAMISSGKEATLGGSRNEICAMFTDVRGFTSFSENHTPEEVVETLNHYLDVQTQVIHRHRGNVDKFLGDGIMAIFIGDQMVVDAIEASIEIQRELAKLNEQRKKQRENVLHVGIGLASGIAVLGSVGSHDRMDFTAIGDTVNLSSRLCGVAGAAEIFVTEEIAYLVGKQFKSSSEGKLPIKGKKKEVSTYKINYALN